MTDGKVMKYRRLDKGWYLGSQVGLRKEWFRTRMALGIGER